jgi:putative membrane protein
MKKRKSYEKELSEDRTVLSNERTLLSYIRTAFAVIVAGIAILGFFKGGVTNTIGFIVLFGGIAFLILGLIYYFIRKRKLGAKF